MKYIVMKVSKGGDEFEMPFIFPNFFVHDHIRQYIEHISIKLRMGSVTCVAAGFCNFIMDEINCTGESESIGIKSRGEIDNNLIRGMDYFHGIMNDFNLEMLSKIRKGGISNEEE